MIRGGMVEASLDPDGAGLARAAAGGVAWQGSSYLLGKLLVLATTAALARLLAPADFGVVGLALVFIAYADGITDLGVAEALVYLPASERTRDAALVLSLVTSGILCLAGVLAAPAVGAFFHRPDAAPMVRVLALSLLVSGSAEVPDALLRRGFAFRQRFGADLGRVLVQGAASVALAASGAGPWSIVGGYLAGGIVWSAVAWSLAGYRPGRGWWRVRREVAGPLLAYGAPAAANVLLLSLVFDVDYLIVGRRLGPSALGFYTLAFRLPEMAIINVFVVLSAVSFPLFSRARQDPGRLRRAYLTVVRLESTYGVAAGAVLAVTAPLVVSVLFGGRWQRSVGPLEALALYAAFRSLGMGAVDAYKGTGRPRVALLLALVRLAVVVPALLVGARFGIVGVAWAQAIVALAMAVAMQAVAARVLGLSVAALLEAVRPAALAGALGAAAALGVRFALPRPAAMSLVLAAMAGAGGALGGARLGDRNLPRLVLRLVRGQAPPRAQEAE